VLVQQTLVVEVEVEVMLLQNQVVQLAEQVVQVL
jgi:hypothetical protein